ncbi:MAG TPA: S8 family serine peptidase, partial [Polyangia bacterium]|nr:S8 family serine peptidase [Polyangia bacterium]
MVIDEGIDVTAADFRGKIVATYTSTCKTTTATTAPTDAMPSFADVKSAYIAQLQIPDDSCTLTPSISAKTDPFATLDNLRSSWNDMLREQKFGNQVFSEAEFDALDAAFKAEFVDFPDHGTTTAGTVAHENPDVRLVLVERTLEDDATRVTDFVCLEQAALDQTVALLSDPDVRDAYAHAPVSQYTIDFLKIVSTFNVGLINESYGTASRTEVDMLQQMNGCAAVDSSAYFAVMHDVHAARLAAQPPLPYLAVQSAGNDGQEIDSGADDFDCIPEDTRRLLVGSTKPDGARSTFSNFGACVNVVAPGERVIAPYAGGWLLPVQGTSYSAPFVTRALSMTATEPFDPAAARAAILARLGGPPTLSFDDVPRDFFYLPDGVAAASALTVAAAPTSSRAALVRFDVERALAPVRALRTVLQRR